MAGRGAWNVSGAGGTKKYKDATKPGPYYYLGTGTAPEGRRRNADEYAVYRAVIAYQRALNRALGTKLLLDGLLGPKTSEALTKFQTANQAKTGTPWGGVGPDTSEALLTPYAVDAVKAGSDDRVTLKMVTGTVRHESLWDAGAVGYTDPDDLGLAQINKKAHPDYTNVQRLTPSFAMQFIVDYYTNALNALAGNIDDAVASYNLGIGGARSWIAAGRPDTWSPSAGSAPRDVRGYIDSILKG